MFYIVLSIYLEKQIINFLTNIIILKKKKMNKISSMFRKVLSVKSENIIEQPIQEL
jgi:hypothetical protein